MSPTLFAVLASIGAVLSWGLNTLAAFQTRAATPRFMFFMTSVLAASYAVAWSVLWMFPSVDRVLWSELLAPLNVMTFFTVWCGFPLLELIKERGISEARQEAVSDSMVRLHQSVIEQSEAQNKLGPQ